MTQQQEERGGKCGQGQGVGERWRGAQKEKAELTIGWMESQSSRGTCDLEMLEVVMSEPISQESGQRALPPKAPELGGHE